MEALEERTAVQLDRAREILAFERLDELDAIDIEWSLWIECDLGVACGDRALTQRAAQGRQGVAQRVTRASLVMLRPEEPEEGVARDRTAGQGEDGEHRELQPTPRQRGVFLTAGSHEGEPAKRDESEAVVPQGVDAVRCG